MDETRKYQTRVVADNIRRLRILRNWSQAKLAEEAKISSVAMYESGKRYPGPDIMPKLAKALGVTVSDLTRDWEADGLSNPSKAEILGDLVLALSSLNQDQLADTLDWVRHFGSESTATKSGAS